MKRIQLEIEALSPLAISRQKPGGSVSEVEDYIPGSVIRGAMAAVMLRYGKPNIGDDFHRLFLGENPAIFQNAYPATLIHNNQVVEQNKIEAIRVIPATALSSKNQPGFHPKGNGVFDTLIDRFFADHSNSLYDPNCPKDGDRVEPFGGFYCKIEKYYHKLSVNKRLLTRVGINRKRATSEESILYSLEVLNESITNKTISQKSTPAVYRGSILLSDEQLGENFIRFIDNHSEVFRLGGSTSRGLGKVKITAKVDRSESWIESRIVNFNQVLKKRLQTWEKTFSLSNKSLEQRTYFTIDLQSDAILTEQWQRTTVISEEMLQECAEIEDSSLKLEAAYSSYDYLSGWNSAWGLMKDVELITNKGGVYFFSTEQGNLWLEKLKKLELKGVGERTMEGFGQIQICNEFHLNLREEAV